MARIRFIHAADLHLDSPFTGLKAAAPENVAAALYDATFKAYENIIDLCISEQVDALLVAGDVYDGADRSLRAQLRFIEGLKKLDSSGIRSFVCHGNHDPLDGWEARLNYPSGCHRFGAEWAAAPVFEDEPERAVVHGVSYPAREVRENLVRQCRGVSSGPYTIGLLHANVGNNPGHDSYAPCSLDDLQRSGIDYWALGHVHTRQELSTGTPTVVYPGNSQGRQPNESGPKGAYLVEVDDSGRTKLDFRPVDTVRWEHIDLDVSGIETEQNLLDRLHERMESALESRDGRGVVARVTLSGSGVLHGSLRRSDFLEQLTDTINNDWAAGAAFAWCERIEDKTASPFDRKARLAGSDFLAELLRTADHAKDDPELMNRLRGGLSDLYEHRRFRRYLPESAPNEAELAALVDEAEAMIVDLLIEDDS